MPVEVVSTAVINRAVLARQRLLRRSSSPIPRVLEAVGGLQTQYAPSGYVGLWSRMQLDTRARLTRALRRRTVLQGTLMRATIHMVSASDYAAMAAGVGDARRAWWLRTTRPTDLDESDMHRVAQAVRVELAAGPRPRAELIDAVKSAGFPETAWAGVGFWVDLIRVPPSGTWERRRADLYGLAEHAVDLGEVDRTGGLELLLRRYLAAFGPAPIGAAANWAGVPTGMLEEAAERLTLRHLRDADGTELIDLPRAPLPDPDHPAPPRFLPTWDAVLLVHARRSGILPEEYRPLVFHTRNPQSVPTFVIDGRVAGSWKYDEGRVVLSPYEPIPTRFADDLEGERRALERFHLEVGD
jgi:hypothetical protein